jgi:hypothetical protein
MAAKSNSCFWLATVKKIFSSETAWPNGAKLGRKHLCKILYKTSSFNSIRPTNKIKIWKVNGRTTDAKWWQYLTWPFGSGELKSYGPKKLRWEEAEEAEEAEEKIRLKQYVSLCSKGRHKYKASM